MMIDVQAAIYAGAGAALVAIGGALFGSAFADRVRRGLAVATAELSELRSAHDEVSTRARELVSAQGAIEGELADARKQLDARERERVAAEARAAELQRRLDEAAREKTELAANLEAANASAAEIERAKAAADEAARARAQLEARLAAKDDELKAAKAAAAAATKAALGRTRDMTADGELAAARRDVADLKKTLEQLRSEKDLLSEKLDAQGRLIEAARARSRELQEELKRLKGGAP